tara:strand:- start:275 stop:532 length:258 start_codon:yes stop_codon:yes gene_type:complete
MKIFVYKTLFVVFCAYVLFQFTIGRKIQSYESTFKNLTTDQGRDSIRNKLRDEIKKANNKDKILNNEDKDLINKFISKIQNELNN